MGKDQELLEAARSGNVTVVEKILGQRAKRSGPLASLRRGPGANVQDPSGYSALHHAALNGHKEVVKLLLQYEASTNVVDTKGSSPLHLAAWAGDAEIVRLILTQGPSVPKVNLTTKDNETALHCAAQYGHTEVVAQLLQYGCDPSIRNSRGESALDLAAQYGRLETVQLLVSTYPELIVPLRNSSSSVIFPHTPLHLASRNGHRAVVEVLLAAGVDVNTRTSAGTAMHEAALCGKMEVVRTLLDRGIDLAIRDSRQNTVLDLLGQFPPHVTQDITAVIKRHRSSSGVESDADSENLPPIPVQGGDSLGSPYENVRPGDDLSPAEGTSPTQWQFYHKPRDDDRRVSGTSVTSFGNGQMGPVNGVRRTLQQTEDSDPSSIYDSVFMSMSDTLNSINTLESSDQTPDDKPQNITTNRIPLPQRDTTRGSDNGLYQTPPVPRGTMEGSFVSEDLSLTLPTGYGGGRESDQLSVSSSSSVGGPSPRDRHCLPNDSSAAGIYLPMAPLSSSLHSPASNNKVSPTPPKKPPRRNLSVSPTHLQTQMSLSADCSVGPPYEYLFMARSGARSHIDLEQLQKRREQLRHVTRSVDQYVEMKSRVPDGEERRDPNVEPVAITSIYENRPIKTLNPRRKLRRHAFENYEPGSSPCTDRSPCSEIDSLGQEQTFVSNAFLTLKSSQESLLDEKRDTNDEHSATEGREATDKRLKRVQMMLPTSPTHYVQPPTPDHPPPSAMQAEKFIHERIRPLSQVYKRRSRDMETETDEDLLQFPAGGSLDASSGSLSSVSLSDKSMSTDNVEEYFGDVPFAGLLKGSMTAERPRTLRRLRNVYGPAACGMGTGGEVGGGERIDDGEVPFRLSDRDRERDEKSLSIMSPFDEQEEWAKISEIMASIGTGLVRESVFVTELEKEFQTRLGLSSDTSSSPIVSTSVGQWLSTLGLADYETLFVNSGFDDLDFINGVLDEADLKDMEISSDQERAVIMDAVGLLNKRVEKRSSSTGQSVDEWLKSIHLENYAETFRKHLYTDMDRVRRVWEDELATVLEIQKPAHRKRILASLNSSNARAQNRNCAGPNLEDLNKDLNTLKTNIQQLKEEIREKLPETTTEVTVVPPPIVGTNSTSTGTGTLRHRKNRPAPQPPQRPSSHNGAISAPEQLEIRAPSELLFGVPSTLKTQWRHQPRALVTGCVTYVANYLGSTVVKELRGTESTKMSIQKLKKTCREPRVTPDITLAISYRGVRFLNTVTNEPICEHEIRNIHCACQDADDLTHFAYITKDHASSTHFCHVFCVPTMDQATEVILTLGQAFEVAYQMALRDKPGHTVRSQSANQLTAFTTKSAATAKMSVSPDSAPDVTRDHDHPPVPVPSLYSTCSNAKPKPRSKSSAPIPVVQPVVLSLPLDANSNSSSSSSTANCAGPNTVTSPSVNSVNSSNSNTSTNQTAKPLVTHGRSHSVNDIKLNGNQLKLAPVPVDDIGIGVKDMKPGSRAPIALSEEL
ncbi:ankyrin repeat and sterile alpha motif domain-containing protein 1B-like isoform X1 [Hylaeus volcanicus]|uniref:ankyrin repeat and sterile alpha motif domain-containing protein 1B-like isoform X1 n=1 Tax=Hylaeus volcanicus TaxID=313075 RepID=UPI0023B7C14E|nr:ankyrin repeat and sterile alpha motif domain-containing protein 1B-like isoform X1 [Hylaeus volcanicus]